MEYVVTLSCVLVYHASRSVLLTEVPASHWHRGEHILACHADGDPRCIACRLCSVACPAYAITVLAGIASTGSRTPAEYVLCTTRCIYCGWCDAVCPTHAILHTGCTLRATTDRVSSVGVSML
uniref:NADH dehydrogenase subunit 8 n=1 Tax=Diplonema papillatum TaxID=91374 RepID=A0A1L6C3Z8_9EUGL|nr:NADH dehydrogenase subunit 8 [Diplonema papillatum]